MVLASRTTWVMWGGPIVDCARIGGTSDCAEKYLKRCIIAVHTCAVSTRGRGSLSAPILVIVYIAYDEGGQHYVMEQSTAGH